MINYKNGVKIKEGHLCNILVKPIVSWTLVCEMKTKI